VAERRLRQRLHDHVKGLLEDRAILGERAVEALELVLLVTGAEPDLQAATGEVIHHRDLLRDLERVVQRQHDDGGAEADVRRTVRELRDQHQRVRQEAVTGEVVLGQHDVVEADRVRELDLLDGVPIHLARREHVGGLHQQEHPELHGRAPFPRLAGIAKHALIQLAGVC